MWKFYSIDSKGEVEKGKLLSEKEFVSFYSNEYYSNHGCKIKNLRRSSFWVEKQIHSILENGIQCELDVAHIMAWKIGKIKHAESEKQKKFCYANDWINTDTFEVKLYRESFDLKKLAKLAGRKNVEMIHQKDLLPVTGYMRGGCSPVGMKKQFPTYMDESILNVDEVAFSAGKRGFQMIVRVQDILAYLNVEMGDIIRK